MIKKEFYALMKKTPKAEVHLHIEAVPTIKTLKFLYKKKNGEELSNEAIKELFSYEDLNGFIQAFLKVQDLFTCEEDLNYVFKDLRRYLINNNIVYTEAFFAPTAFLKKGFDYKKMIDIFSKNIKKIKGKDKITIKLLMDVSRTFGAENAMNNYNLLLQHPCEDIIGIGLGGAESKGAARDYKEVYEKAIRNGHKVTAHAGEDVGAASIWEAIDILHCTRIGHGVSAREDTKLIQTLKERQVGVECCVTSNLFTKKYIKKISEHPIRQYFDEGLLVTVNTDDPVFFKTSLIEEYWKLYKAKMFSLEEIKRLILNSFRSLFIEESEKEKYYKEVEEAFREEGE